jgi:thymidylate synthase
MRIINISANDLPDSWFQLLYSILDNGREFKIDKGSYAGQKRLEFDYVTVHIKQPFLRDSQGWPLIPIMPDGCTIPPPTTVEYISDYSRYIMTADKEPGEQYTYGERLFHQIPAVIKTYKKYGYRNNQMVLQVARPEDIHLSDPPCLRHIDTRIQDNKLHFFIYFRSWDLWGGYPSNLAGLSILQEYMASEIGVAPGEFVCSSKGLHLYDYVVDFAKIRCMKR